MSVKLTTRVTLGVLTTVGIGLGVAALAAWLSARHVLHSELDRLLLHVIERHAHRGEIGGKIPRPPRGGALHMMILHPDGNEWYRSPDWPTGLNPKQWPDRRGQSRMVAAVPHRLIRITVTEKTLTAAQPPPRPSGNRGRRRGQPLPIGSIVAIAVDYQTIRGDLRGLATILLLSSIGTLLLAWLVTRALCAAILRPLTTLAVAIDSLPADDPTARLPHEQRPPELSKIADRVDYFLTEVAASRARERRALAATAHELRTPLADLRSRLGFALRADKPQLQEDDIQSLAHQVDALSDQVDRLLILSRLEAGTQPIHVTAWDWVECASAYWQQTGDDRQLAFTGSTDEDLVVDPTLFPLVIHNLLTNARDHGKGTATPFVIVDLTHSETESILTVSNPTTLPNGDLNIAAEPYWQADTSRSDANHSGLGLSIVETIIAAHGGRMGIAILNQRFQVRLIIPHTEVL